ncbi:MAG: AAA family ATPase [Bacteroidaceae bacterium]|nr:AAA family ATPase [Bacteroidaceae bacterium]
MERACNQTDQKLVILIDEYDKHRLNSISNPELQDAYRSQKKAFCSVMSQWSRLCSIFKSLRLLLWVTR